MSYSTGVLKDANGTVPVQPMLVLTPPTQSPVVSSTLPKPSKAGKNVGDIPQTRNLHRGMQRLLWMCQIQDRKIPVEIPRSSTEMNRRTSSFQLEIRSRLRAINVVCNRRCCTCPQADSANAPLTTLPSRVRSCPPLRSFPRRLRSNCP